jgi:endonuclease-3 related protein
MEHSSLKRALQQIYDRLHTTYGPQRWWPAETPTEVVIGAILTQNTAWTNVEKAIWNLKRAGFLNFKALARISEQRLARLIRPSGTFRVKAARLKAFVDYLTKHHRGSLKSLLSGELSTARRRLLSIHGVGPETADAILLYAGHRASFVVDAYTRRVLRRHRLIDSADGYEAVRGLFHNALPRKARWFNEYHALLVTVGKRHCRAKARCEGCPLADMPHDAEL